MIDTGLTEDGRRKQTWRGGFTTKKAAEQELTRVLNGLQRGEYIPSSDQTLGEFLTCEWLPAIQATVRATTLRSYEMHIRVHVEPRLGRMPLQKLSGSTLNALYADLAADGSQRREGGLSAATVRRVHAVLHRALRDAVRWDRLVRNPADLADPPRQRATASPEMKAWSAEEVERFLEFIAEDRLYALWVTLLTTGVRRGEAAGLRWHDLDFRSGRAAIRQTLVAVGYEVVVTEPKTSRSKRVVALDAETLAILNVHHKAQLEERLLFGSAWQECGLVFVRPDGSPLHPDRITKLFDGLVKRSGLPRIRLHDLRHTHATLALRAGVHPKVVSDRLGHSTTTVTLDTYSHVVPALQEEAAAVVASLFLKPKQSRPATSDGQP